MSSVDRRAFLRVSLLATSTAVTGGVLAACVAPPSASQSAGGTPAAQPTQAQPAAA